jgi:hypothetical protein
VFIKPILPFDTIVVKQMQKRLERLQKRMKFFYIDDETIYLFKRNNFTDIDQVIAVLRKQ